MKGSMRLRPVVLGIILALAGVVLVFWSFRQREQVVTIAPGVHLVRPAGESSWELLVDSAGGAGGGAQGGVEAEHVTQYTVLADGRVVVEGAVDGAASWLVIGPTGSDQAGGGASILAMFPSRASLDSYLARQSQVPPLLSAPVASSGVKTLRGGVAMIIGGGVLLVLGASLRRDKGARQRVAETAPKAAQAAPRGRGR